MSNRTIAAVVGTLFISQILTFAVGSSLIAAFLDGEGSRAGLTGGVLLEIVAGVVVVTIGVLMYRILKPINAKLALGYPILRAAEFTVSAVLAIYLLTQLQEFPHHLAWVYLPTALGGLILNYLLFNSKLVPRAISVLGLVGYALLLTVVPLDLLGIVPESSGAGLAMLAPGGAYEFLVLPLWLIVKGFQPPQTTTVQAARAVA